jgi:hypothetical protein
LKNRATLNPGKICGSLKFSGYFKNGVCFKSQKKLGLNLTYCVLSVPILKMDGGFSQKLLDVVCDSENFFSKSGVFKRIFKIAADHKILWF